jgi:hypothetical protein
MSTLPHSAISKAICNAVHYTFFPLFLLHLHYAAYYTFFPLFLLHSGGGGGNVERILH